MTVYNENKKEKYHSECQIYRLRYCSMLRRGVNVMCAGNDLAGRFITQTCL